MADIKITTEMMKSFNGDGDVVAWLRKAKLVAKLKKIDDQASFLPLYLEGDALALYLEMSDSDQADVTKIEARLKQAFTEGAFSSYSRLGSLKWVGEQVDVYANEIRRLAGLSGFKGEGLERIIKLTFVNGFPDHISVALQQVPNVETMEMSELVTNARVLTMKKTQNLTAVAAPGSFMGKRPQTPQSAQQFGGKAEEARVFKGRCFRCNGPHMIRDCKEPKPITCYKCNQVGHLSIRCNQGNDWRVATAPEATPTTK